MAEDEDDGTFSAPWWKARAEAAERDLQGYKQEYNKAIGALHEAHMEIARLQTPADDRRLAEIRARVEAATEGPWEDVGGYSVMKVLDAVRATEVCRTLAPGDEVYHPEEKETNWKADGAFIAASREDVPYLLAEIDRLKGTLASYADSRTVERKAEVSNDKH